MSNTEQIVGTRVGQLQSRRFARTLRTGLGLVLVVLTLTACGQTGPLYLPAPPAGASTATPQR